MRYPGRPAKRDSGRLCKVGSAVHYVLCGRCGTLLPCVLASALVAALVGLTGCSQITGVTDGASTGEPGERTRSAPSTLQRASQGAGQQITVTRVVDGDTVEIEPAVRGRTDLRLIGVDSPELSDSQPLAQEAADFTTQRLEGEQVRLTLGRDPVDPYDRLLGTVERRGDNRTHGQALIEQGYAQTLFYEPNTRLQPLYKATQESARERDVGIWGLPLEERCELTSRGNGIGGDSAECDGV